MNEVQYIDRFINVVDSMRVTGGYSATVVLPTPPNIFLVVSDVETFVKVDDYVYFNVATRGRVVSVQDWRTFTVDTLAETIPLVGTWKSMAPYADYGTRKTIDAKLLEKNSGQLSYQKFPLIALRLPVTLTTTNGITTAEFNILIATFTNKQYKPQERIENVFKPILYPLLYKFLDRVKVTGYFAGYRNDYTHIDRLFYGTDQGDEQNIANVFTDPLDAIEVRDLNLNYFVDECP
jgi:hypothetical protein